MQMYYFIITAVRGKKSNFKEYINVIGILVKLGNIEQNYTIFNF